MALYHIQYRLCSLYYIWHAIHLFSGAYSQNSPWVIEGTTCKRMFAAGLGHFRPITLARYLAS